MSQILEAFRRTNVAPANSSIDICSTSDSNYLNMRNVNVLQFVVEEARKFVESYTV